MSLIAAHQVTNLEEAQPVYQTIYETAPQPTLTPDVMQPATEELGKLNFNAVDLNANRATFRDGERYVTFLLEQSTLTVRLGVGSHDTNEAIINSMRLDEMIGFLFGGMKRGCHCIDEKGLDECMQAAIKDLKEFAHEFLRGDFRPFLRVLAIKKREERETARAQEAISGNIYLA